MDCCAFKKLWELGVIHPHYALTALITKWIVKALILGEISLTILLRHKIVHIQPSGSGVWLRNIQYSMLHRFSAPGVRQFGMTGPCVEAHDFQH